MHAARRACAFSVGSSGGLLQSAHGRCDGRRPRTRHAPPRVELRVGARLCTDPRWRRLVFSPLGPALVRRVFQLLTLLAVDRPTGISFGNFGSIGWSPVTALIEGHGGPKAGNERASGLPKGSTFFKLVWSHLLFGDPDRMAETRVCSVVSSKRTRRAPKFGGSNVSHEGAQLCPIGPESSTRQLAV